MTGTETTDPQGPGWSTGDWVVRREVLANGPWAGMLVKIIEDSQEQLISYIPEGSPFGFPRGNWPTPDGMHPWSDRGNWQGPGCLMIQRPADAYAIWHFWRGPERDFVCWYINLQEPFRRTAIGYDTQDLELDFIVYPDGRWEMKDDEYLDLRAEEGRWSTGKVQEIRAQGERISTRLEAGERWWQPEWRNWVPDPGWKVPVALPVDWNLI
jgi:Protein of unknown function (DUF402)